MKPTKSIAVAIEKRFPEKKKNDADICFRKIFICLAPL
jgi:hypothetical protein